MGRHVSLRPNHKRLTSYFRAVSAAAAAVVADEQEGEEGAGMSSSGALSSNASLSDCSIASGGKRGEDPKEGAHSL
jgi:hypothetical protein